MSERSACESAEQEEQRNQEAANETWYESDIAKQALGVARYQGRVFWWQALAASGAFIAAGVAAWGAYRAFLAAEGTLTHAQSVSEAELRPYMFPAEVAWHHMNTPGNPDDIMNWRITVVWKNSGQTPARKVAIVSSHEVFDLTGFPDDFGFPDKESHKFVGAVGPAQSIAHRKEIPLADFEVVYQKMKRQFFWMWVEYSGIAPGKRYRTECCYEIVVPNDPTVKDSWQFMQATFTDRFNGFDDTCYHQPKT
jgi:hypothetical protein